MARNGICATLRTTTVEVKEMCGFTSKVIRRFVWLLSQNKFSTFPASSSTMLLKICNSASRQEVGNDKYTINLGQ